MRRKHSHAHPSLFESFVQRVPIDLQTVMGCRLMKRTRQTKNLAQAYVRAVVLGEGYARLFAQLKDQRVAKLSKSDAAHSSSEECRESPGADAQAHPSAARQDDGAAANRQR